MILYELLSGKLPFDGDDHESLFEKIRESDPPTLTTAAGEPLPELDAVIRRSLAKNSAERYPSATALAEDLERWLNGEKVHARPPRRQSARRWAMIGLAACALAAVLVAATWKPAPEDTPIPPPQVLIGETGKPVYGDPIAETKPLEALSPKNVYTLASEDVALVDLGEHWFDGGIKIEADVRQISISNDAKLFSYAGLYCCGKFFANPDGRILNAVTVRLDTVEAGNLPPQHPFRSGLGSIDVGRWSPSENNPWNLKQHGQLLSLFREQLTGAAVGLVNHIRIEIGPDQRVSGFINDAPLQELTAADRNACFDLAIFRDQRPRIPANERFGQNIGLVVQRCRAAFQNVIVRPLATSPKS